MAVLLKERPAYLLPGLEHEQGASTRTRYAKFALLPELFEHERLQCAYLHVAPWLLPQLLPEPICMPTIRRDNQRALGWVDMRKKIRSKECLWDLVMKCVYHRPSIVTKNCYFTASIIYQSWW